MVDLYCERLGPGLWSEPLNASTNLSFFLSAFAIWKLGRKRDERGIVLWPLVALSIAIGIGSGLFHTYAETWAGVLDVASIIGFQLVLLWLYCRTILGFHPTFVTGLLFVFVAITLYARQFPEIMGGSLPYLPAVVVLLALGFNHLRRRFADAFVLLIAAGIFVGAVVLRSIDGMVCEAFPTGTHFLWHVSGAVVLYLATRAYWINLTAAHSVV